MRVIVSQKILMVLVPLTLAILFAGSRIKVIELGYEVSRAKSQTEEMVRTNNLLKSKVAQASSTSRLADWAKHLNMASPETNHVLFLDE